MKVDSFLVTLLVFWMQEEGDCFGIITHFARRIPASVSARQSKTYSVQLSNKSHHGYLASSNVDDDSSASVTGGLEDRIMDEFKIGSKGLNGEDGVRFLYPGLAAVLAYPPDAQEAWINAIVAARDHYAREHENQTRRYLQREGGLKGRIMDEFQTGSHGLYGEDGVRFLYPGLTAVLAYPPDAQEAWINGIVAARDHYAHDHQTRRHFQTDDTSRQQVSFRHERKENIAIPDKRVTTFQRFKKRFISGSDKEGGLTFRQQLAKMGLSVAISYGFVSNLAGCSSLVLTWYIFSKKTGLSPLSPGQWKPFLAVYAGFYIFHNIVRPARFALAVALGPKIDSFLAWVQKRWRVSNKGLAILIVMFSLNIVLCTGSMCAGILLASQMTGVPIFPGK